MKSVIDLTVGDTVLISGPITQKRLKDLQQSDLDSVTFSLIRPNGTKVIDNADAELGLLDTALGSVPASYLLTADDTATAVEEAFVRWNIVLSGGRGNIHAPGKPADYTIVRIHA